METSRFRRQLILGTLLGALAAVQGAIELARRLRVEAVRRRARQRALLHGEEEGEGEGEEEEEEEESKALTQGRVARVLLHLRSAVLAALLGHCLAQELAALLTDGLPLLSAALVTLASLLRDRWPGGTVRVLVVAVRWARLWLGAGHLLLVGLYSDLADAATRAGQLSEAREWAGRAHELKVMQLRVVVMATAGAALLRLREGRDRLRSWWHLLTWPPRLSFPLPLR